MSADPRALADSLIEQGCEVMHDAYERAAVGAGWETQAASRKPWADVPEANKVTMRAAVSALVGWLGVVPLHDAWLKANPPCPNPSHSIECPWTYNDGMEDYVYRCSHPCGHSGHHQANGTYPVSWDSDALGARLVICPDCPDGVQPFDKWTAGLVALWTHVGLLVEYPPVGPDDPANKMIRSLRQIGGTR